MIVPEKRINLSTLTQRLSDEQMRFFKFALVGGLGTLLDFSLLTALKLIGWPTLLANSLSFTAGLLNNFTLNRLWTFRQDAQEGWQRQLLQFSLVSLVGLALNNLILLGLEGAFAAWMADATWAYIPAKLAATGLVLFWNYFANRHWTFRQPIA
jgi:putative flippase GtrA